jgi:hypothetical protein
MAGIASVPLERNRKPKRRREAIVPLNSGSHQTMQIEPSDQRIVILAAGGVLAKVQLALPVKTLLPHGASSAQPSGTPIGATSEAPEERISPVPNPPLPPLAANGRVTPGAGKWAPRQVNV